MFKKGEALTWEEAGTAGPSGSGHSLWATGKHPVACGRVWPVCVCVCVCVCERERERDHFHVYLSPGKSAAVRFLTQKTRGHLVIFWKFSGCVLFYPSVIHCLLVHGLCGARCRSRHLFRVSLAHSCGLLALPKVHPAFQDMGCDALFGRFSCRLCLLMLLPRAVSLTMQGAFPSNYLTLLIIPARVIERKITSASYFWSGFPSAHMLFIPNIILK